MRPFKMTTLMFLMSYLVSIGQTKINAVEKITIEASQGLVADRCIISLPGQERGKQLDLESKIKRGDKVVVQLGYDGNLQTEFEGYLKSIKPNSPLELEVEDAIFLTRREVKSKVFKNVEAKAIAQYTIDELNKQLPADQKLKLVCDVSGMEFSKFSIHQATGYEVLDKLRQESGLAIFARKNELHVHLQYTHKTGDVTYDFTKNVEDTDNLEYQKAGDAKLLVKVTGKNAKGDRIEGIAGETGGDTKVVNRPNVSNEATLNKIAQQTLKQLQYEGYKGSLRGWLVPYCEVGYSAKVVDQDWPEREGKYYVSAVRTEFSSNGGIRTVTLGVKVS